MAFNPKQITKELDNANLAKHNDNYGAIKTELDGHDTKIAANKTAVEAAQADINTHKADSGAHLSAADRDKLDGIEPGAEPNQNAFAKVNNVEAGAESDALTIAGGTGITVTTNPTTKTVTVTATGDATPGAHGDSHNNDGADPIPDLVALRGEFDALTAADIGAETPAGAQAKVDALAGAGNMKTVAEVAAQLADLAQVEVTYNGVTKLFKNQSTTLYVDIDSKVVSGNDGLSASKPIKLSDIETIFNKLKTTFPILLGNWVVQLAAGTYQGDGTKHMLFIADVDSTEYIEFKGADIPLAQVPTTVLDGSLNGTRYMHGLYFQNMNIKISNIKVQNFSESNTPNVPTGTRAGIALSGHTGKFWAYNVHSYLCSWGGIVNQGTPRFLIQGGKFEYCRQGVMSMFNTQVSIGYNGSPTKPEAENTRFVNNVESGCTITTSGGGHVDYCYFDDHPNRALDVISQCEINAVQNTFRNNSVAMAASSNSRIQNLNNIFSGNAQNFYMYYGGYIQQTANSDAGNRRRQVDQMIDITDDYFTKSAPSGGGVIFTQVLQPGSLFGRGKTFELVSFGRVTNASSNTCSILMKATDGTNNVTLATIPIASTSGYIHFKLNSFLSNYSGSNFSFNSEFVLQGAYPTITNANGIVLDSKTQLTITLELVVNGTASNTLLNTYRTLSRVVF